MRQLESQIEHLARSLLVMSYFLQKIPNPAANINKPTTAVMIRIRWIYMENYYKQLAKCLLASFSTGNSPLCR